MEYDSVGVVDTAESQTLFCSGSCEMQKRKSPMIVGMLTAYSCRSAEVRFCDLVIHISVHLPCELRMLPVVLICSTSRCRGCGCKAARGIHRATPPTPTTTPNSTLTSAARPPIAFFQSTHHRLCGGTFSLVFFFYTKLFHPTLYQAHTPPSPPSSKSAPRALPHVSVPDIALVHLATGPHHPRSTTKTPTKLPFAPPCSSNQRSPNLRNEDRCPEFRHGIKLTLLELYTCIESHDGCDSLS